MSFLVAFLQSRQDLVRSKQSNVEVTSSWGCLASGKVTLPLSKLSNRCEIRLKPSNLEGGPAPLPFVPRAPRAPRLFGEFWELAPNATTAWSWVEHRHHGLVWEMDPGDQFLWSPGGFILTHISGGGLILKQTNTKPRRECILSWS